MNKCPFSHQDPFVYERKSKFFKIAVVKKCWCNVSTYHSPSPPPPHQLSLSCLYTLPGPRVWAYSLLTSPSCLYTLDPGLTIPASCPPGNADPPSQVSLDMTSSGLFWTLFLKQSWSLLALCFSVLGLWSWGLLSSLHFPLCRKVPDFQVCLHIEPLRHHLFCVSLPPFLFSSFLSPSLPASFPSPFTHFHSVPMIQAFNPYLALRIQ